MFQDPKSFSHSIPVGRETLAGRAQESKIEPKIESKVEPRTESKIEPRLEPKRELKPELKHEAKFGPRWDARQATVTALRALSAGPDHATLLGFDIGFLLRRKGLIAATIAASLVAVVAFHLAATPRYRAVAQILISPADLNVLDKSLVPAAPTADASVIQVESETRVLTSDKVLRRVVQSQHLATDPEFGGTGGSWLANLLSGVRKAVGLSADSKVTGGDELGALRALQRVVLAKRTERTYVVDLTVDSSDAEKSARIANAIATAYTEEQSAARTEAARRVTESLSARLNELKERVRRAEEASELFKSQNNIVGAGGRLVHEQQLSDLTSQLTAAKARTAEAKARYDRSLTRNDVDPGSTSEAVQSNTIGRLREQYAAAARQAATLAADLGPRHPYVIQARAQARDAERQVDEELNRLATANRIDYERALANENSISQSLDKLKQNALDTNMAFVKLRELEREVEASRAVYESFLVRARETREQERLDSTNVRILSDAQAPRDRTWPPRFLILLLAGLIVGALGGCGLAYALEQMKRTAPRPSELASLAKHAVR